MPNKPATIYLDMDPDPELLIIDSFCGAGGVTDGFEQAEVNGKKVAVVIVGINHDAIAIESHKENHPETLHFVEDMRTLDLAPVIERLRIMKKRFPNAKVVFHASLECTEHSKAKGGLPKKADSRTLPEHLYRYIEALNPDYITIENVMEFKMWGPLTKKGKPMKRERGKSWIRWKNKIKDYGYRDDWKALNAADFGAFTRRNRLFGMFTRKNLPIAWPQQTHCKNNASGLFSSLPKWKGCRPCMELEDEGKSIFIPGRIRSDASLLRFTAGIEKYVRPHTDQPIWIDLQYSNGTKHQSIDDSASCLTTVPKLKLCKAQFISEQYGNSIGHSINETANTIVNNPKQNIVSVSIVNKIHSKGVTLPDLPDFVKVHGDKICIEIDPSDSTAKKNLKKLMAELGIVDIKMRMLKISELKKIQGFRADYILKGTKTDQKKFIGNSVVPVVMKKWSEALVIELRKYKMAA